MRRYLQIFGHKPKYMANWNTDLVMALDEKSGNHQSHNLVGEEYESFYKIVSLRTTNVSLVVLLIQTVVPVGPWILTYRQITAPMLSTCSIVLLLMSNCSLFIPYSSWHISRPLYLWQISKLSLCLVSLFRGSTGRCWGLIKALIKSAAV